MAKAETDKKPARKARGDKRSAPQSNPVTRYLRETRGEIRKVTWPTREESYRLTAIVIGVMVAMSLFLFGFDAVFSSAFEALVNLVA